MRRRARETRFRFNESCSVPERGLIPNIHDAPRTTGGCSAHRISLLYRKRLFFTPNASENASRTPGVCFEHRMRIPYHRMPSPVPNATNGREEKSIACSEYHKAKMRRHCLYRMPKATKEKIACIKCHNCQKRGFPPDPKRSPVQKAQPASSGKNKKRTTSKIVLFPIWGAMWGSNPRHPEPQSGALPTELIAPCQFGATKVQRFFGIPREYSKKELSLCDLNKNRIREYVKRD